MLVKRWRLEWVFVWRRGIRHFEGPPRARVEYCGYIREQVRRQKWAGKIGAIFGGDGSFRRSSPSSMLAAKSTFFGKSVRINSGRLDDALNS